MDETLLKIAKTNGLVRQADNRYNAPVDLETSKSGADFYEVAVWSVKAALEAAYKAGKEAALDGLDRDIMNMPAKNELPPGTENHVAYKLGHKQARHDAIELVLERRTNG